MYTLILLTEAALLIMGLLIAVQLALYLYARRRNERFFATRARLNDATKATVKEVQQVLAEDFKKARVDHRLKGDTVTELRAASMKIILANLGPLGIKELRKVLGLSRRAPLDRFLVGRIEAAVYDLKERPLIVDEIPPQPGDRIYPNTLRIPRVEKPTDHPDENLFDEKTHITGR
jgi:hypothetical protein